MFADQIIIIQIVTQGLSLILMLYISCYSIGIIRHWQPKNADEMQLQLERRTFLVSRTIQFILVFQIIAIILLMNTINVHLPGVIRGSMCAAGILNLYPDGYLWLYLQLTAVLLAVVFLFINFLDNAEPEFPLTPFKYWLVFPITFLLAVNFIMMLRFFNAIEPDIITTCCSISFDFVGAEGTYTYKSNLFSSQGILTGFYLSSIIVLLLIYFYPKHRILGSISILGFLILSIFALKLHFAKYIYALPSHDCLFDMFLSDYNYIGYLLFGLLFILLSASILINGLYQLQKDLLKNHRNTIKVLKYTIQLSCLSFTIILTWYWFYWKYCIM